MTLTKGQRDDAVTRLASELRNPDIATPLGRPNVEYLCASQPNWTMRQVIDASRFGSISPSASSTPTSASSVPRPSYSSIQQTRINELTKATGLAAGLAEGGDIPYANSIIAIAARGAYPRGTFSVDIPSWNAGTPTQAEREQLQKAMRAAFLSAMTVDTDGVSLVFTKQGGLPKITLRVDVLGSVNPNDKAATLAALKQGTGIIDPNLMAVTSRAVENVIFCCTNNINIVSRWVVKRDAYGTIISASSSSQRLVHQPNPGTQSIYKGEYPEAAMVTADPLAVQSNADWLKALGNVKPEVDWAGMSELGLNMYAYTTFNSMPR